MADATRLTKLAGAAFACAAATLPVHAADGPASSSPLAHGTASTSTPSHVSPRPDPHLWTRRNLDLIREAATAGPAARGSPAVRTSLMFSMLNPLIVRDPYAGELLRIVEAAATRPGTDAETRTELQGVAKFLRLPQDERVLRQLAKETRHNPNRGKTIDRPLARAGNEINLTSALTSAPAGEPYDTFVPRAVEQMDAAARAGGRWDRLALAYSTLAHDAWRRGHPDRARTYTDRMLAIVRAHPNFRDPSGVTLVSSTRR